jgi:hypothetical protein
LEPLLFCCRADLEASEAAAEGEAEEEVEEGGEARPAAARAAPYAERVEEEEAEGVGSDQVSSNLEDRGALGTGGGRALILAS